jgi:aminomethyltransferase
MAGKRTTLGDWHEGHGAHFVPYGEYDVPAYYDSVEREYQAMQKSVGMADFCHLCRIKVTGNDRESFLNKLVTRDLSDVAVNGIASAYVCNERGGIIDEVAILKTERFFLVQGSPLRRARLLSWFQQNAAGAEVEVADSTIAQGAVELRGPAAEKTIKSSLMEGSLPTEVNTTTVGQIGQARCLILYMPIGRMPRYQVHAGALYTQDLWDKLTYVGTSLGGSAVGREALEILRVERSHPAVGWEIDEDTTPLELGAAMRIDFQKKNFHGRRALLHSTCGEFGRRFVCLKLETDRIPPLPSPVLCEGIPVGSISSCVRSPVAGASLALGFVDTLKSAIGTVLGVTVDNLSVRAEVVSAVTDVGLE